MSKQDPRYLLSPRQLAFKSDQFFAPSIVFDGVEPEVR